MFSLAAHKALLFQTPLLLLSMYPRLYTPDTVNAIFELIEAYNKTGSFNFFSWGGLTHGCELNVVSGGMNHEWFSSELLIQN